MPLLNKGDKVEITYPGRSTAGPYIPATVIRPPRRDQSPTLVFVQYVRVSSDGVAESLLRDYVYPPLVRPAPPLEPHRRFRPADAVDVFRTGSWVRASVSEVLENSKYSVSVESDNGGEEEVVCDHFHLRLHRDWNRLTSSWVPPLQLHEPQKTNSTSTSTTTRANANANANRNIRLKFVCGKKPLEQHFEVGTTVEVTSEEEGYKESWYLGKIIGSMSKDKLLIEYRDLVVDEGPQEQPLRELAEKRHVRPEPPAQVPQVPRFEKLQRVDAWYNDGWWEGVVAEVRAGSLYTVYFESTKEELMFRHSELRPHRDWIHGKWTVQGDLPETQEASSGKSEVTKPSFFKGMNIEVKSDEDGYRGSWYEAKIFESIDEDKFVVEYQTIKTDDETENLKEETKASNIRPQPPKIQRVYGYTLLENVDCWFNDGWWTGHVLKILSGRKYVVYFSTTNEELEFDHYCLRPHMEWVHGKWVYSHVL